ncbi:MAG: hypothetical protein ACRC5T_14090 [Cetobacterium sp.]
MSGWKGIIGVGTKLHIEGKEYYFVEEFKDLKNFLVSTKDIRFNNAEESEYFFFNIEMKRNVLKLNLSTVSSSEDGEEGDKMSKNDFTICVSLDGGKTFKYLGFFVNILDKIL